MRGTSSFAHTRPTILMSRDMLEPMRDEVDGLIEAWRSERPDVDVTPLEVFSRVSRLSRHLDRARRTVFIEHSLEPWEFDVLAELRRSGPPYELSPGKLLRATLVTSDHDQPCRPPHHRRPGAPPPRPGRQAWSVGSTHRARRRTHRRGHGFLDQLRGDPACPHAHTGP